MHFSKKSFRICSLALSFGATHWSLRVKIFHYVNFVEMMLYEHFENNWKWRLHVVGGLSGGRSMLRVNLLSVWAREHFGGSEVVNLAVYWYVDVCASQKHVFLGREYTYFLVKLKGRRCLCETRWFVVFGCVILLYLVAILVGCTSAWVWFTVCTIGKKIRSYLVSDLYPQINQ